MLPVVLSSSTIKRSQKNGQWRALLYAVLLMVLHQSVLRPSTNSLSDTSTVCQRSTKYWPPHPFTVLENMREQEYEKVLAETRDEKAASKCKACSIGNGKADPDGSDTTR